MDVGYFTIYFLPTKGRGNGTLHANNRNPITTKLNILFMKYSFKFEAKLFLLNQF